MTFLYYTPSLVVMVLTIPMSARSEEYYTRLETILFDGDDDYLYTFPDDDVFILRKC